METITVATRKTCFCPLRRIHPQHDSGSTCAFGPSLVCNSIINANQIQHKKKKSLGIDIALYPAHPPPVSTKHAVLFLSATFTSSAADSNPVVVVVRSRCIASQREEKDSDRTKQRLHPAIHRSDRLAPRDSRKIMGAGRLLAPPAALCSGCRAPACVRSCVRCANATAVFSDSFPARLRGAETSHSHCGHSSPPPPNLPRPLMMQFLTPPVSHFEFHIYGTLGLLA